MSQTKTQLVEGLNINTSAPATALQIDASGNINLDSNTLYVDATNNRVGLGTSTPSRNLTVYNTASNPFISIESSNTGSPGLLFGDTDNNAIGQIRYDHSADKMQFSVNGSERAVIDSSGRLGIGTTSPQQLLHIRGASANAGIRLESDGGSGQTYEIRSLTNGVLTVGTTLTNVLNVTSSNVGIGTTSPGLVSGMSKYLTLASTGSGEAVGLELVGNRSSGNQTAARISFINSSAEIARINCSYQDSTTLGSLEFYTSGSEKARIDSSGRLLVGTSTARANLYNNSSGVAPQFQIEGTSFVTSSMLLARNSNDGNDTSIVLGKTRGTSIGANTVVSSGDGLGAISFQGADGSELVEAASIQALVDGTPGANDMPGRLVFSTTADGASSPTERMRLNSNGRLVIGTTAEIQTGENTNVGMMLANDGTFLNARNVASSNLFLSKIGATDGDMLKFSRNGSFVGTISVTASATAYNTSSDYRLKENVVPLTGAVDRLNQLQVHRFNFIADPDKTVDGFIAHEAQAVVPECVTGEKDAVDEDGNPIYQGIDQSKLVPLLTAALQEAIGRIETLEAEVAALKGA